MRRRSLSISLVLASVATAVGIFVSVRTSSTPAPLALAPLPGNAADAYAQAVSRAAADGSATDSAVDALLRGSRMTSCDWEIPLDQGIDTARNERRFRIAERLVEAAIARAQDRFEVKRTTDGLRDLLALMTFGRHLTWHTPATYRLFGAATEEMAIDAAAGHLYSLSRGQLVDLRDQLARLPAPTALSDTVTVDKQLAVSVWRQAATEVPNKDVVFRGLTSVTEAGVAARMDQVARLTALPHDQFPAAWSKFRADVGDNFICNLVKGYERVRGVDDRIQVRRAMLFAAIDIRLSGPSVPPTVTDPLTHQPFEYTPLNYRGFDLRADNIPPLHVDR